MRVMKDSGIKWIGRIPKDWDISKIGTIYEERNIRSVTKIIHLCL